MYSTFWKVLFSTFMFMILFVNIAFTFDMVQIVNPTAIDVVGDYHDYYFGFGSIVDSFKSFYGDNSTLKNFSDFLTKFGGMISQAYNKFVEPLKMLGAFTGNNPAWEIISALFALVAFTNSVIPMFLLLAYVVLYAVFLVCFAFTLVSFVIYWFGGGFATPLPSTDWWEYSNSILNTSSSAILVNLL